MNFSEILKQNSILKTELANQEKVDFFILSNITLNQLAPILEYELRSSDINGFVKIGEYDNILQTSEIVHNEIPIIFWELSNLKESFIYEIELFSEDIINKYVEKTIQELKILFNNLKNCKQVIFNKFSHITFTNSLLKKSNFENFVEKINNFLEENLPNNFILIDINKVIATLGVNNVINLRNYYLSKTLYTVDFFKEYAFYISPIILSIFGKSKKALIFDCDNTLWGGIVGEDGVNGIELSEISKKGIFYKEVQILAKSLSKRGIILGLCSKNNEIDVNEVFEFRNDMQLSSSDISIKKINWNNKSSNLISIADELNIAIESIVFVDDSSFEIELIKENIPKIQTLQVPQELSTYATKMLKLTNLFYTNGFSKEDLDRTKMYQQNKERQNIKDKFENLEDYLESLDIIVEFTNKDLDSIDRIAQLTQKTNQFNLTTKRYSISEINRMFDSVKHDVVSINVSDKFGNSGLTGICIIEYTDEHACIDSFLMSCRILGRNIEKLFLSEIVKHINNKGFNFIYSTYKKTNKNVQTEFFYENNDFILIENINNTKKYKIETTKSKNNLTYIKTTWKKK